NRRWREQRPSRRSTSWHLCAPVSHPRPQGAIACPSLRGAVCRLADRGDRNTLVLCVTIPTTTTRVDGRRWKGRTAVPHGASVSNPGPADCALVYLAAGC